MIDTLRAIVSPARIDYGQTGAELHAIVRTLLDAGLPSTPEGRTKPARSPAELSVGERAVVRDVTATFGRLNLPAGEQDHGRVLAVHASGRGE